jgi:3-oxoacyl-[acyl-carrier protein] reductase
MLKDKIAVITGASRGIGRAIALKMAESGANVAVIYAGNEQAADETCGLAEKYSVRAKAYKCDVSSLEATKACVKEIISDFGGIDILVNNAGITRDSLLLSMQEEDFDAVINTNLKGTFHMIKNCYTHFMRKRAGRIINISSVAGIAGNAGQANYSSAKAGVIGLTKTVAKELAGRGVTCNAIAPGFIDTDMTKKLSDKAKDAVLSQIPMKHAGTPEDVAGLAVFLAGPNASYITGEVIRVDGGLCI